MSDINSITVTGRLTRDPELRQAGGSQVLRLSLACGRSWTSRQTGEREERTTYFDCDVWGPRAQALAPLLRKGMQLAVSGSHESDVREAGDGARRTYWTLRADEVVLPPRAASSPAQAAPAPARDPGLQAAVDGAFRGAYADEIPF